TFPASHIYRDDPPPGSHTNRFVIKATAIDDDGGPRSATIPVEVDNIVPKVAIHIDDPQLLALHSFVRKGTIDDPGLQDTETVRIDWGDGQSDLVVLQPNV